jgi:hypothetical protein
MSVRSKAKVFLPVLEEKEVASSWELWPVDLLVHGRVLKGLIEDGVPVLSV